MPTHTHMMPFLFLNLRENSLCEVQSSLNICGFNIHGCLGAVTPQTLRDDCKLFFMVVVEKPDVKVNFILTAGEDILCLGIKS